MNDKIIFGGIRLPSRVTEGNFAIAGATASGKTVLQRGLWQSFLPRIGPGEDRRAVLYDYKRDQLAHVMGLPLRAPVVILDPFDARSQPLDIAADVTTPAASAQLSATIFTDLDYSNVFWTFAGQDVDRNQTDALNYVAPRNWTFRDKIQIANQPELLRELLSKCPQTKHVLDNYKEERTFHNVMSTVRSRLGKFSTIAALWHSSKNPPVSLNGFPLRSEILFLRDDPSMHESMMVVNQLILKRLQEGLLTQDESRTREVLVALDEFPMLGKLSGLPELLLAGRSKGVRVILGFQEIDSVRKHYKREGANELIGQCSNLALLRVASPETARWASEAVGQFRRTEWDRTIGHDGNVSYGERRVERHVILPSDFMSFPPTGPDTGLTGVFLSPWVGAWKHTIPWSFIEENLIPSNPSVPDFISRPPEDQYLKPFDDDDYQRLGLTPPPKKPQGPQGNKGQRLVFSPTT